jgi:hypothetical protein
MDLITPAITIGSVALKAGGFDIQQFLGIKPKGSNDSEYARDVSNEVQRQYDLAQGALSKVNPLDSATINGITSAYQSIVAGFGNLSNPNRNDPRVASGISTLQSYVSAVNSASNTPASTTPADTFSVIFDANGTPALFNRSTGVTTPVAQLSNTPATSAPTLQYTDTTTSTYMPVILIGVGLLALFLIFKKH